MVSQILTSTFKFQNIDQGLLYSGPEVNIENYLGYDKWGEGVLRGFRGGWGRVKRRLGEGLEGVLGGFGGDFGRGRAT